MGLKLFCRLLAALAAFALAGSWAAAEDLKHVIEGTQRGENNRARDIHRHPLEVLAFFGVKEDSSVVEIWPAPGYWTEILAPYLKDKGHYTAAGFEPDPGSASPPKAEIAFAAKLAADPGDYGKVVVTGFAADRHAIAPPGSADFVLTFCNLHNWLGDGSEAGALAAIYKALKPGGVLGLVDHRGAPDKPQDPHAGTGYVRQDFAIALAEKAGFKFVASSEADANPKDTKDYSGGVWALPPVYKWRDKDREHYAAIGESDRFVLKFVKPAN